jgi:hypothetical protein
MAINLSTNTLQSQTRNTTFSETVNVTVDGTPPEVISSISVTPSQSDSGVTISTTTSSITFSGSYEDAFNQDKIKSFPSEKSVMLKDAVVGVSESNIAITTEDENIITTENSDVISSENTFFSLAVVEEERELTREEFELKQQEFPNIVQPTTSTSFAAVPSGHTIFSAIQDNRATVVVQYDVTVVYDTGTHTDTITHTIKTDTATFANKLTELFDEDE